ATLEPAAFKQRVESLEPVIRPSDTGWFSAETTQDYEDRVSEILESLVRRPRAESKKKSSRINTEITREFKRAGALAKPTESIEDHKVVRDYLVAVDEDLRADFALKNGAYHVTATLDLRRDQVHIKEATWKAIVLDRAKAVLPRTTRRLGVYAAAPQAHQFKSHIQLLGEYADDVFNWADHDDRQRYTHAIYQAMDATLGERE
ncbi:MAG TPA: hypothetical protein VKB71_16965, partial [Rhizomicrobium sp.]|nr:hypothetical protein [Rhizomicrobium sp.]